VAPGLYVTSAIVARQGKVLDEFGITHVISIQAKPISPFMVNEKRKIRLFFFMFFFLSIVNIF
jgi:hypothetical protein